MVTLLKITMKVSFEVILEACELILGMSLKYNLTSWCILQLLPQIGVASTGDPGNIAASVRCPCGCIQHGGLWLIKCIFPAVVMPDATCFHLDPAFRFN
ncbi:unnamed protein product [Sphagnum jensenii]|uniref:Uncharacterized protein n=1 Tax=Sphagnum jensenii TaxID=128206 RepID=A0ABP0WIS7_9BRYO